MLFKYLKLPKKIRVSLLFLNLLLVACSGQEVSEPVTSSKSSLSADTLQKEQGNVVQKPNPNPLLKSPTIFDDFPLTINGEKFKSKTLLITEGSRLFNVHMSQSGTVKGTLVVVAKLDDIKSFGFTEVTKITEGTYKVKPKENDLMSIYKAFTQNKKVERVELEIDYSSLDKSQLF